MLQFDEAVQTIMGRARTLGTEEVPLEDALGRVLAEKARSDMDMPPFNKSAMDGYACRRADVGAELTVLETVRAGQAPTKPVTTSQCSKIMTGAPVPEGADCVIMVEYTEEAGDGKIRFTGDKTADNICQRAEDLKTGDVVLERGVLLKPQHVAVLASTGSSRPRVYRKVRVGVLATGDELVPPGVKPSPSQIRDSNSLQLVGQAKRAGAEVTDYGIIPDDRQVLEETLRTALDRHDVVFLTGGVSMGDYDYVPEVMAKNGVEILFDRLALKPGKPTTFGVTENAYCFGLPGNPVSVFVQFEILLKPFLRRLMGMADPGPRQHQFTMGTTMTRKKVDRGSIHPVNIDKEGRVAPLEYHGSAHIHALCHAAGLIMMPAGVRELTEGSPVSVYLLE